MSRWNQPGCPCCSGTSVVPGCGCGRIPTVLNFTDSILGSCVLTYTGIPAFGWIGFLPISFPGRSFPCASCDAQELVIGVRFWNPGLRCIVELSFNPNPGPFGTQPCWLDATSGAGGLLGWAALLDVNCDPFNATGTVTIFESECDKTLIYGTQSGTVTMTLTP